MPEYYDDAHDEEPIEGYCMHCRESVEMEETQGVWTRKGQPATRGICPICGGSVFRMGRTHLHENSRKPDAVIVAQENEKRSRPRLARDTVYVNYSSQDEEAAQRIADDLNKAGLAVWLHDADANDVNWSSGVHPALKECARMVFVLSSHSGSDAAVSAGWQFFREQRKPIVIAQIGESEPPDAIRRSPRFNFAQDYKLALRQMIDTLSN